MAEALVDSGDGRTLFVNGSGRWAADQMMRALSQGKPLNSAVLRTNDTLKFGDWIYFDTALVEEAQMQLVGVADLIARGLTRPVSNALGKTILTYQKISEFGPAGVSMDGITRTEADRQEFDMAGIPLPITHKDWWLDLRTLSASRSSGEPLDTTNTRSAGRVIGEMAEQMLFVGGKTFQGLPIYGYTTHPFRALASFKTAKNWGDTTKAGTDYLEDVLTMITAAQANRMYGPYMIYVGRDASVTLENDFKSAVTQTVRQRIESISGIQGVKVSDKCPDHNVVMVQLTSDVVQWVTGEPLQNVQWDSSGGFRIDFKSWQIAVPLIKVDINNRCGVVHMS